MTRTILITGGSRGIGRATASALLTEGYSVAITYRASKDAVRQLEEETASTRAAGTELLAIEADVRDRSLGERVVEQVMARLGSIDGLVNNAGIRSDALAYNLSFEQWDAVLETNLNGSFAMVKAVLPVMMRQRRGSIVNVASLSGSHGVAGQTNYAAAKGGLIAMTRSLAREVARSGIRVNCVSPGLVDTDMIAELPEETRKEMIKAIPIRRLIRSSEIAAAISFLLSDRASAITGHVLTVDGGTSA